MEMCMRILEIYACSAVNLYVARILFNEPEMSFLAHPS